MEHTLDESQPSRSQRLQSSSIYANEQFGCRNARESKGLTSGNCVLSVERLSSSLKFDKDACAD
jgi:hypothetical protein